MSTTMARALRFARLQAGLSQSEAAALVHVTVETWGRYERGAREVSPAVAELFCAKVGIAYPPPDPGPDADLQRTAKPGPKPNGHGRLS